MFFNPEKVLNQDFLLNFVVSERGAGKTFSTLKYLVEKFISTGRQFVYLRRTETERDQCIGTLLDQLQGAGFFTDHKFKSFKDYITCDGKIICYCFAISTAYKFKSTSFYKVDTVVFDEFIDENNRYLKDEVRKFLSFFETIARLRDNVQIICLGNLTSKYNPYFIYFKLKMSDSPYTRYRSKSILINNFKSEEYRNEKLKTKFGKLISGTEYGNFMLNNQAIGDDYSFIDRLDGVKKIPLANIIIEGTNIRVYEAIKKEGFILFFQVGEAIKDLQTINYDKILVENARLELIQKMPISKNISYNIGRGSVAFFDMKVKILVTSFIF